MRRANGSGTVFKMGGNRRKPYVARIMTGSENGKPIYDVIGYFEKGTDATKELNKYVEKGIGARQNFTLEKLYEEWKKDKFPKISKSTQENYSAAYKHLFPLYTLRVADIKKSQMQTLTSGLELSYSSVHKVKTLLSMLWDYAMSDDIVDKNYASMIELQKQDKKEKAIFTDIQIKKINELAKKGDEQAMVIMILIYTGLRIGELFEMTRFAVDLKKNTLTGGLKTDAGKNRVVPIALKIRPYIKHWYDKNNDLLISRDGAKITNHYFRDYWFYKTLTLAGIKDAKKKGLTPHATRHTCATLLSRAGVDVLSIQRIMGHSTYAITADLYTHTDNKMLADAIAKI